MIDAGTSRGIADDQRLVKHIETRTAHKKTLGPGVDICEPEIEAL